MSDPREPSGDDMDALTALEQEAFADRPWSRRELAGELDRIGAIALVVGRGPPLAGAALGWAVGEVAELTRISVAPSARRRGLGRRLLAAFEARARSRGAEVIWLEVRADNAAAIGLYRDAGYTESGRRTRYYADGCDAVLMGRRPPRAG